MDGLQPPAEAPTALKQGHCRGVSSCAPTPASPPRASPVPHQRAGLAAGQGAAPGPS